MGGSITSAQGHTAGKWQNQGGQPRGSEFQSLSHESPAVNTPSSISGLLSRMIPITEWLSLEMIIQLKKYDGKVGVQALESERVGLESLLCCSAT